MTVYKFGKQIVRGRDAYCVLYAKSARATAKSLTIALTSGATVIIPISRLGDPWNSATPTQLSRITLESGGSTLWWSELDEGFQLDEVLPSFIGFKPASLLARAGRGKKASPAKASAARKNGAKGGRPRKHPKPA